MEAICYENLVDHFNNQLQVGKIYLFKNIGFDPADVPLPFKLDIDTEFIIILRRQTEIYSPMALTVIPSLPQRFTHFSKVNGLRNNMLVGTLNFIK